MTKDEEPVDAGSAAAWFAPSGDVIREPVGAIEGAGRIASGWIRVDREADGWHVAVRDRAVPRQAAQALAKWVREGGVDADRPATSPRDDGSVREIARGILETSWDAVRFPDPADEVAERLATVARLEDDAARFGWLADAAEAGGALRPDAMRSALRELETAAREAYQATTACYARIDRNGTPEEAIASVQAPLEALGAVQGRIEAAAGAIASALVDAGPRPAAAPVERILDPDPLVALREVHDPYAAALAAQAVARRRFQEGVPHKDLLVRLSTLTVYVGTPRREIAEARRGIAAPGLTAKRIGEILMYRVGHECGRGYHTLGMTARQVGEALRKARHTVPPDAGSEAFTP